MLREQLDYLSQFEDEYPDTGELCLIGEPVKRKDGRILSMYELRNRHIRVLLEDSSISIAHSYSPEEVNWYGQGDSKKGLILIGQAYLNAGIEKINKSRLLDTRYLTPDTLIL